MTPRLRRDESGFTLIELLLSVTILVIIMSAITTALIVFLQTGTYTSSRDDHSSGASTLGAYLDRDVASADRQPTTGGVACSGKPNILVFTWQDYTASSAAPQPTPTGSPYVSAYFMSPDPAPTPTGLYAVVRAQCAPGAAAQTNVLVRGLPSPSPTPAPCAVPGCPVVVPSIGASGSCTGGWATTLTLKAYGQDSASPYTYSGCAGSRKS
jgi:prepilin-type N-terminal cleavage/methylation domain-containing protein